MESSNDFIYVHRKHRLRTTGCLASARTEQYVLNEDTDLDEINTRFRELLGRYNDSDIFNTCIDALQSLSGVCEIVCYGLGNFSLYVTARLQLVLLKLLIDRVFCSCKVVFSDPCFTKNERLYLKELFQNCTVSDSNDCCTWVANTSTVFYMCHCGKAMYNNLLYANWFPAYLKNCYIIGNSFNKISAELRDDMITECGYILKAAENFINEIPLFLNYKSGEVHNSFCDTSLHIPRISETDVSVWTRSAPLYDKLASSIRCCAPLHLYMGKLPPRWRNCPRKGELICDLFIPFKTPLGERFNEALEPTQLFPPSMVFSFAKNYSLKVGLWFDLTNTRRFYDSTEVENNGAKYVKLFCKGHGDTPSLEQTDQFIRICQSFISSNPNIKIGVHCTHGFNRSGFLIVSYLVQVMDCSVEGAVELFARSRPPGIYKQDYLRELFSRYGSVKDMSLAPALPDWCNESDEPDNDEEESSVKSRKGEVFKKNAVFYEGVVGVEQVMDQNTVNRIRQRVQQMCDWNGSGFPGSQVVSFDQRGFDLLRDNHYKVSWKADGVRYLIFIDGKEKTYFLDRDNTVFHAPQFRFPRRKQPDEDIFDTLLDGEMVCDNTEQARSVFRMLAYDAIRFEGQPVGKTNYDTRLLCIRKEIIGPRSQAIQDNLIDRFSEPFSIREKTFYDITATEKILSDHFTNQLGHEIDGVVFQPFNQPYYPGRNPMLLKWKPASLNSVDFKLQVVREKREGCLAQVRGYLHVGGMDPPLAEIKMTKELFQLNGAIIECRLPETGPSGPLGRYWSFMRQRTDKSHPNAYSTAINVIETIKNPITKDALLEFIRNSAKKPSGRPPSTSMPPPTKIPRR